MLEESIKSIMVNATSNVKATRVAILINLSKFDTFCALSAFEIWCGPNL